MKIFNAITLALCTAAIGICSCDKSTNLIDENNKWVYLDSSNSANVKVIQVFAGNTPQVPTAPNLTTGPQVFIYANSAKLNGTSIAYGSNWPTPNVYANIPAGSTKFEILNGRMDLTVVPNIPKYIAGDTLSTLTATLEKGKYYSLYVCDTVPTVRLTLKEDILPIPDYQTYKIRVSNFLMNNGATDTTTLNLFSVRQNAEIITDISPKNVSNWVQLPLPVISDTLIFRKKGSTAAYLQINGFAPTGQRMYTAIARGKNGVTAKLPSATTITNR